MRILPIVSKSTLCLLLFFQANLPLATWASDSTDERDLKVEELMIEESKSSITLWVLSIGVSRYADETINLKYADNDAVAIAEILKTQDGPLFNEVQTKVLTNEEATRSSIIESIHGFLGQANSSDVVVIFLAGHGLTDPTERYYFIPFDANANNYRSNGLPKDEFISAVKNLQKNNVNKVILLTDTCHSGAMGLEELAMRDMLGGNSGMDLAEVMYEELHNELAESEGLYFLAASRSGQLAAEDIEKKHGLFTSGLLEGLTGAAAKNGVVRISRLFEHISKKVRRWSDGKQTPWQKIIGTDIPIFLPNASNNIPIVVPGKDQMVHKGELVTLDGRGSHDLDGDELIFKWELAEGPAVLLLNSSSPTPSFKTNKVATYKFKLTVSDGRSEASDEVIIQSLKKNSGKWWKILASVGVGVGGGIYWYTNQSDGISDPGPPDFTVPSGGQDPGSGPSTTGIIKIRIPIPE